MVVACSGVYYKLEVGIYIVCLLLLLIRRHWAETGFLFLLCQGMVLLQSLISEEIMCLVTRALSSDDLVNKLNREDLRFRFLRLITIKKCPHMLRSDHKELRNS